VPDQVRAIRAAGMVAVGHLGLLPQTAMSFKQTGRTEEDRERILREAETMEKAGCSALVLEHIPSDLGKIVTESIAIPTVGIGAGPHCGGQVLVLHDLLGLSARQPPFAPARVNLRAIALEALKGYHRDVSGRTFPAA
jgi:3-methyl-2-oxobutanoate hydroxymethyltransferase